MSLEHDLHQEQVSHLDLNKFAKVEIGTSVRSTVEKMREEKQNCAIIVDDQGFLVGIFTDRDILKKVADSRETWDLPIEDVMTRAPLTVNSKNRADVALALMDYKHFRNVPVLDDKGKVIGNLTHYAVIKYLCDRFPESTYNLPPYPEQVAQERGGA